MQTVVTLWNCLFSVVKEHHEIRDSLQNPRNTAKVMLKEGVPPKLSKVRIPITKTSIV